MKAESRLFIYYESREQILLLQTADNSVSVIGRKAAEF